jgi:hypothetical protein
VRQKRGVTKEAQQEWDKSRRNVRFGYPDRGQIVGEINDPISGKAKIYEDGTHVVFVAGSPIERKATITEIETAHWGFNRLSSGQFESDREEWAAELDRSIRDRLRADYKQLSQCEWDDPRTEGLVCSVVRRLIIDIDDCFEDHFPDFAAFIAEEKEDD